MSESSQIMMHLWKYPGQENVSSTRMKTFPISTLEQNRIIFGFQPFRTRRTQALNSPFVPHNLTLG